MFTDWDEYYACESARGKDGKTSLILSNPSQEPDGIYATISARFKACGHDNPMAFNQQRSVLRNMIKDRTGRYPTVEQIEMIGFAWDDPSAPRVNR